MLIPNDFCYLKFSSKLIVDDHDFTFNQMIYWAFKGKQTKGNVIRTYDFFLRVWNIALHQKTPLSRHDMLRNRECACFCSFSTYALLHGNILSIHLKCLKRATQRSEIVTILLIYICVMHIGRVYPEMNTTALKLE